MLVDLYVETIQTGENLEQKGLTLHHGLSCLRADVSEPEHSRAVGNHGHEIAFVGIFIYILRMSLYLLARIGHAR